MALNMIRDSLKTGGYAFITIPNGYGPWELFNRLEKRENLKKIIYAPFYFPVYIKNIIPTFHSQEKKYRNKSIVQNSTLNKNSPHVQFWTYAQFIKMVHNHGFKLHEMTNTNISYNWIPFYYKFKCNRLDMIDIKLADYLPPLLASGWIFSFKKL